VRKYMSASVVGNGSNSQTPSNRAAFHFTRLGWDAAATRTALHDRLLTPRRDQAIADRLAGQTLADLARDPAAERHYDRSS
jgi:hypothetical protein